jgi:hypothetical protein
MLSGTGYPMGKKPARVQVWVRTCTRIRAWVFYRVELKLKLAGAGIERHCPTGFYPLPSLDETIQHLLFDCDLANFI